jgi:hypothetical protein
MPSSPRFPSRDFIDEFVILEERVGGIRLRIVAEMMLPTRDLTTIIPERCCAASIGATILATIVPS